MQIKQLEYGWPVVLNLLFSLLVFVFITELQLYQFQFIAVMYLVPSWGIAYLWYVDTTILKGVNTYEEIVLNKNIAYAIHFLAFTLLVVTGIVCAFLLYFSIKLGA